MLSSLERYCPNKNEGCEWTGKSDMVKSHYKNCSKKSRASINRELEEKDILISLLKGKISASNQKCALLEEENVTLKDENQKLQKKIKVYEAFFNHDTKSRQHENIDDEKNDDADEKLSQKPVSANRKSSDVSKLANLRNFEKKNIYL